MRVTAKRAAIVAAAVLGTAGAVWAVPISVSEVTMTQRANSRIVDIGYTLTGEDAIITLSIETNGVAIPNSAVTWLTGDVCQVVQPGERSILWNAGVNWPENVTTNAKARVTAWSADAPPLYCAVDVAGGTAADTYPVYYYTSSNGVPRGVTNYLYKTDRILMRRLAPTDYIGFSMGEGNGVKQVILTHGFYAGVYLVTQSQWQQVMGDIRSWPASYNNTDYRLTRPVEQVSYFDIRENPIGAGSAISPNWPETNAVHASSFMGRLRTKTGLADFDLPTEAQWEYACRAGTTTYYNDGRGIPGNTTSNAQMNVLGRYKYNGGVLKGGVFPAAGCGPENGTAIVGSYVPNTWGLYDMHGNLYENCLDWYGDTLSGGTNPPGPSSSVKNRRSLRGGCWATSADLNRSGARGESTGPNNRNGNATGFRLVRNLL